LGKLATTILARGPGWSAAEAVCDLGPRDRPYEEQHNAAAIGVVVAGSFQYRSAQGSELLAPGSMLLGSPGRRYECRHEHGVGDRCLDFEYDPEFLERAGLDGRFGVQRLPPLAALATLVLEATLAAAAPAPAAAWGELTLRMAAAVFELVGSRQRGGRAPSAADVRRVSLALRAVEAHLAEPLPLGQLAASVGMSAFHFLRVFRQVVGVTPHQYVRRARLRAAAVRLRSSAAPVQQVALDAGFGDLSNFIHAFAAEFGRSPRGYRAAAAAR